MFVLNGFLKEYHSVSFRGAALCLTHTNKLKLTHKLKGKYDEKQHW
jgi:hypothetical protein